MMSSQQSITKEEEDCLRAIQYATSTVLPFALKAAVDLDLFEIIAKSGPGSMVSAAEIVSKLPAKNPNAPEIIDRILRFLTAHSVLDCKLVTDEDGNSTRLYGIASIGKYFVQNEYGISIVPLLHLNMDRHMFESWKLNVRMMSSQQSITKEEEDCLRAIQYATSTVLPFALKAAVDLDLFEIIAKSGPGSMVSAAEIVSKLPAKNPNAPEIIDRILRFLTAHSVLDCKLVTDEDGNSTRLYGIASIGKYFVQNEYGISIVPLLHLNMDRHMFESWLVFFSLTLYIIFFPT
ncbi:hypothetical protein GOBAR_AA24709 [Gossypium barbadense]|uniref:O-methyltransferase dimerisation domain-containing protein n=2 Tax=Gossypium barbadense TaxID=3634 RepID=A0A2P5WXZ3_GOSBA|nr:hypothetical protein GOBAR_AA24709 [Gossypium barbadense]